MNNKEPKKECRVLQVFSGLGVGGAETWLMALLRYFKERDGDLPFRVKFDVCLTGGVKSTFDDEAISLGANLFYLQYRRANLPSFIREFRSVLAKGKYNVIHDHQDYTAGVHLLMGAGRLPPVRIVHVHNTRIHIDNYSSSFLRRATLAAGKLLISRFATHIMGTSRQVVSEYGFDAPRFSAVERGAAHCGFDVDRFKSHYDSSHKEICSEFGWDVNSKILLFVGRLDSSLDQKNPGFALEVAKAAIAAAPDVRLLLAGGGELAKTELEKISAAWGLKEKIRFLGARRDIPRLMSGSDLLLLPSRGEGLGMVVVEAQAAGLRALVSDVTPRECEVVPGMLKFLPLGAGPSLWSREALAVLNAPRPDAGDCNRAVAASGFSIENSAARLMELYTARLKTK